MRPPSRANAERRYELHRTAARAKAQELIAPTFEPMPVMLTGIGQSALDAFAAQWAGHPARVVNWPWPEMMAGARRNYPTRFEVAVWAGEALCGLAWGHVGKDYCGVNYLEGNPEPNHPLKGSVAVVVSGAVTAYATALARPEVRFIDPLPEVVGLYEQMGFTLVAPHRESPYCVWKLP